MKQFNSYNKALHIWAYGSAIIGHFFK